MLPKIIQLNKLGDTEIGFISVVEKEVDFEIKRVYWTYKTPVDVVRGNHAHKVLKQLIIAVSGVIIFKLENKQGEKWTFNLNQPNKALYIPCGYWREIEFSKDAVLLCLASEKYEEYDYIRSYSEFKNS